jgi:hypothetical protein
VKRWPLSHAEPGLLAESPGLSRILNLQPPGFSQNLNPPPACHGVMRNRLKFVYTCGGNYNKSPNTDTEKTMTRSTGRKAAVPGLLLLLSILTAAQAMAGNRTIGGYFDGTESTMAANPVACDNVSKGFQEVGTIQVSTSGTYEVSDAGNFLSFDHPNNGVADIVVLFYAGSFSSASPATNRVGVVDEGDGVALTAGTTYVVVVQHWCVELVGAFALVIRGPGDITGAGFNSLAYTFGQHRNTDMSANFPLIGTHRYDASEPVSIFRSGNYWFGEVGLYFSASTALFVYEGTFDPNNTSANLVDVLEFAGFVTLEQGKKYVFVSVDLFDDFGDWQFALFPPGSMIFNPGMSGAWVTSGVGSQGILMEVFGDIGILFFAWFTFPDAVAVVTTDRNPVTTEAAPGIQPENHLGSTDQRWLTASGLVPDDSNFMNVSYENSTGGAFDSPVPVATTDSNYGTGWIEAFSCNHIQINYDLPGGIAGTTDFRRILGDGLPYCYSFIKAAPPSPPF